MLATGTDGITADGLLIDTNRDGLNFDCCRGVQVRRCRINSPNDDGICLKSSYALGRPVVTEDVVIEDCRMTGKYRIGSVLDGGYRLLGTGQETRANVTHRTGRVKLGTESIGGFRRIVMRNLVFHGCRGLALETVDGGVLEEIDIAGVTMRDVRNAPVYIRLGGRLRAPPGAVPGQLARREHPRRRLRAALFRHADDRERHSRRDDRGCAPAGHPHMRTRGGGSASMAAILPPEAVRGYPDPESFGIDLPACGLFARHVKGLTVTHLRLDCARPDHRPAVWLQDVERARIAITHTRGVRRDDLVRQIGATRHPGEA